MHRLRHRRIRRVRAELDTHPRDMRSSTSGRRTRDDSPRNQHHARCPPAAAARFRPRVHELFTRCGRRSGAPRIGCDSAGLRLACALLGRCRYRSRVRASDSRGDSGILDTSRGADRLPRRFRSRRRPRSTAARDLEGRRVGLGKPRDPRALGRRRARAARLGMVGVANDFPARRPSHRRAQARPDGESRRGGGGNGDVRDEPAHSSAAATADGKRFRPGSRRTAGRSMDGAGRTRNGGVLAGRRSPE